MIIENSIENSARILKFGFLWYKVIFYSTEPKHILTWTACNNFLRCQSLVVWKVDLNGYIADLKNNLYLFLLLSTVMYSVR